MGSKPVAITGIKPADPAKPPSRLEIREMQKKFPDQFNLLLLAMEQFKATKDTEPMSYYQIAGIHGRPYGQVWPRADPNKEPNPADSNNGYCTHSSCLFLTWHRPYLALFETALSNHVKDIASKYVQKANKDRYMKAAEDFRLPYWDWALPPGGELNLLPIPVLSETIHKVRKPGSNENTDVPMDVNPLSAYVFQQQAVNDTSISQWRGTKRSQTVRAAGRGNVTANDLTGFNPRFKGKNLTERMVWILQSYLEFNPMSHNKFPARDWESEAWTGYGSLEDAHNSVHVYVGGHMSDPSVAAFDPVFWFHHCNIDRLFAIWQALHDDKTADTYVQPAFESGNRFLVANNPGKGIRSVSNANTPLLPFTKSETPADFYNSGQVRSTKSFGYVYPETQDWVLQGKDAIKARLSELYAGASVPDVVRSRAPAFQQKVAQQLNERAQLHREVSAVSEQKISWTALSLSESQAPLPKPVLEKVEAIRAEPPKPINVEQLLNGNQYLEWLINVRAQKHANDGDFMVHFFLGQPEDERPDLYVYTPNHIAVFYTFGQGLDTGCEKCKVDQAESLLVTGQIPLTLALVERAVAGEPVGLDVPSVERYLAQHLHWRVTNRAGVILPRNSIDGLLVGVVTNQVTLPENPGDLPTYAPTVTPRPNATTNASGDSGRGEGTGLTGTVEI